MLREQACSGVALGPLHWETLGPLKWESPRSAKMSTKRVAILLTAHGLQWPSEVHGLLFTDLVCFATLAGDRQFLADRLSESFSSES